MVEDQLCRCSSELYVPIHYRIKVPSQRTDNVMLQCKMILNLDSADVLLKYVH